jgi:hypothetical protein
MKKLLELVDVKKISDLVSSKKGKKPLVIAVSVIIFVLGSYAVQKGYITIDMLNNVLQMVDSAPAAVDAVSVSPIDSLQVVDSVSLK